MKRLIPLVCLFFLFCSMPIQAYEQESIDKIEDLIELNEVEDISSCSKELNDIYKECLKNREENFKKIQSKKNELKRIETSVSYYNEQMDTLKQEISLYLCLYQLSHYNTFDSSEFENTYSEIKKCIEKERMIKKEIHQLEDSIDEIDYDLKRIETLQEKLFSMYTKIEHRNEGVPNPYSMIQGMEDLPAYGGMVDSMSDSMISCLALSDLKIDETSTSWIFPIPTGSISAGTWAYPSGDMHLGLDVATPMYSNVYAPINGIILYADACTDSDNGYLGNWVGWPLGGGNTICMIGSYENQLYAFSFCHLSNQIKVYPGQQVKQGDVLALSGNSGNSTGPHCHIEVFSLQCTLEEAISYFINTSDFTFNNGYNAPATCSNYACRIQPESIWG